MILIPAAHLMLAAAAGSASIPAVFQGEFAQRRSECGRAGEGSLYVRADGLSFWEAFARVERITVRGRRELTVQLTYSADDESWITVEKLRLSRDGRKLHLVEEDGRTLTWLRCPSPQAPRAAARTPHFSP
jgi:hypothetical protein